MAKQIVSSIPINNFLGQQTSPAVALPVGSTSVVADFDGATMTDPAQQTTLVVDYAQDGTHFIELTRSTFHSGATVSRGPNAGQPLPVYPVGTDLPQPSVAASRIRGTLIVPDVPLTTTVHITVA